MKRCLIIGGQNPRNFGSLMLVENYINYSYFDEYGILCNSISDVKDIYLDVIQEKKINFHEYKKKSGIKNKLYLLKGLISNNFNDDNFQDIIRNYDKIVFLGGDDLSEDYGIGGLIYQTMFLYKGKRNKKEVYVCGQTIGPFKSWRKQYMKKILNKVDLITSRDPVSFKYLKEDLNCNNVKLTADLAFLELKSKSKQNYNLKEEFIAFCPSSIVWKYAKESNYSEYVKYWVNLAKQCITMGYKVIIVPHVRDGYSGDIEISNVIFNNLTDDVNYKDKIELIKNLELPIDAREIFKKSKFVITGRMHPAISTLSVKKPVIAISYSIKYMGVIGDYMDLNDYIIDVRDLEWDMINNNTVSKINNLIYNYDNELKKINDKLEFIKEKSLENFEKGEN